MYQLSDITTLHLEVTTKCNARCPMCLRNVLGGRVNPQLPLTELSVQDVRQIFPDTFVRQLRRMYMCGNYGDPIMAHETIDIFRHFRQLNPEIQLEMFTNASGRSIEWWQELAKVVSSCRFSVDGVGDVNALYRRGTNWKIILRNMQAFLDAGGVAEWDFIVFRHNEHQVDEARALAERLGFRKFNVKKTGRFFSNTQAAVKDRQEVRNAEGEVEYYLEPPVDARYRNSALAKETQIAAQHGSLKNFLAQTPINCKASDERSLYVTAEGLVFPCCWTANQLYPWYYSARSAPIWSLINQLPEGLAALDARKTPLASIVAGEFFQVSLPAGWEASRERLFVCAKTCGQGFDAFTAQFQAVQNQAVRQPSPETFAQS